MAHFQSAWLAVLTICFCIYSSNWQTLQCWAYTSGSRLLQDDPSLHCLVDLFIRPAFDIVQVLNSKAGPVKRNVLIYKLRAPDSAVLDLYSGLQASADWWSAKPIDTL